MEINWHSFIQYYRKVLQSREYGNISMKLIHKFV